MRKLRLNNLAEATNLATEIGLSPPKMLFFPVISIPGSPWVGRGEWGSKRTQILGTVLVPQPLHEDASVPPSDISAMKHMVQCLMR